jgi:bacteriorhodopsin
MINQRASKGYWTFGTVALLFIAYMLTFVGRKHAVAIGPAVGRAYNSCGVLLIFVWFLYPIAWGLAEGGNVIHPDSEAVFYGVLDILAKPIFGALMIWGHRNIDPATLGIYIHDYGQIRGHEGIKTEKENGAGPVVDPTDHAVV